MIADVMHLCGSCNKFLAYLRLRSVIANLAKEHVRRSANTRSE